MIVAVLDACVLYPPALRDLFMWLAASNVYQPRWTNEIHNEWMRNVLVNHPDLKPEQLERTRRLMDQVSEESLVTDYEKYIPDLSLPDPDDRHVLAAAIEARADVIVTFNLSDFPASVLKTYHVRAIHPDKYLLALIEDAPALFIMGIRDHRASLKRPPKEVDEYIETLKVNGLHALTARLSEHREEI